MQVGLASQNIGRYKCIQYIYYSWELVNQITIRQIVFVSLRGIYIDVNFMLFSMLFSMSLSGLHFGSTFGFLLAEKKRQTILYNKRKMTSFG